MTCVPGEMNYFHKDYPKGLTFTLAETPSTFQAGK